MIEGQVEGNEVLQVLTFGCRAGAAAWDYCCQTDSVTGVSVVLPTSLLRDAEFLALKRETANFASGKPPNSNMALANVLGVEKLDAEYSRALLRVGYYAIISEHARVNPHGGCLSTFCFNRVPCTSWSRYAGAPYGGDTALVTSVDKAEKALKTYDQRGAHAVGDLLHSEVSEVPTCSEARVTDKGGHVTGEDVGQRVARARFPQMTDVQQRLYANHPDNLVAAEAMRNRQPDGKLKDIGNFKPTDIEHAKLRELVPLLNNRVFTKAKMKSALMEYESYQQCFQKSKTPEECERMMEEVLADVNESHFTFSNWCKTKCYSNVVGAFVKDEVTGKPKPRAIANHGDIRVGAIAKVAWVFEHIMQKTFINANIKYREKKSVISGLAQRMSNMKNGDWFMNDLSSFEFGIGEELKQAEVDILKHIADFVGVESGAELFRSVVDARTGCVMWEMRYIDEDGARKSVKMLLPRPMRESGDRLTSSGNWLQNFLAWFTFLVATGCAEKALDSFIRSKGANLHYVSARDGLNYLIILAFEGDDTFGRGDEDIQDSVHDFFTRWGWAPKLKFVSSKELQACVTFVGYEVLLHEGKAVTLPDGIVMLPETKRILTTKSWSCTKLEGEAFKSCVAIYAAGMCEEYKHVPSMHAFFAAMVNDNKNTTLTCKRLVKVDTLVELHLKRKGAMGSEEELAEFAVEVLSEGVSACVEDTTGYYRQLLHESAGPASDLELAVMASLTTLDLHGEELAGFVPVTWLQDE